MIRSQDQRRLVYVFCFLLVLFCGLIVKFYQIQILEEEKWVKIAKRQHRFMITEPFKRGSFYSNTWVKKGHPEKEQAFVYDVPKFHLYVDPKAIPLQVKPKVLEKVFATFDLTEKEKEKVMRGLYLNKRSRKLISWVDPNVQEKLASWWSKFYREVKIAKNALFFVKDFKRSYPFGSMLGALLHTVQDQKDPHTFQSLPTGGLEKEFDSYLSGKLGKKILYRSPRHPLDMGRVIEQAEDGGDVYLTINHYLQAIAEDALKKGVKAAEAKGGWVILMDPYSGEILALAQYPFFDVREYSKYFNDPSLQEHTRIKAVTDAFEPGSTFKAVSLLIALNANETLMQKEGRYLFHPEDKIKTSDGSFPKTRFKLKDGRRHNYLNFYMALQKSSNIYPGRMVERTLENLGENWFRDQLTEVFGFGYKTGIEIPAETCGLVPKPGRYHPNGRPEWSVPTPFSMAIGHNILVNSLQMIRVYALIANGGYLVKPTILKKIVKNQKTIEFERKEPVKILSENTVREIQKALKYVTKYGGSSRRGDIPGYSEAGKSGTSEKIVGGKYSHKNYLSFFAGFAPADHPRFVMFVAIDEPKIKYIPGYGKNYLGGVCAAPIFSEIGARVLEYLGEPMDDKTSKHWKKEVAELRKLYETWNR